MVTINYRVNYDVSRKQVLDFFKSLGYFYLGKREKAVKNGNINIPTEVFIKEVEGGRFHLFIEFGTKRAGTEAYPQVIVHAHFDLFKKDGNKGHHKGRRDYNKDLNEMYNIHRAMKDDRIGFMEYKSQNVWHDTLKRKFKKYIKKVIERDYEHFENETYKKKIKNGQITFQLITQTKYVHLTCVYAIGKKHDLHRYKARGEMKRILKETLELIGKSKVNNSLNSIFNNEIYILLFFSIIYNLTEDINPNSIASIISSS